MKAIRVHAHGGPVVMSFEGAPDPAPQAGQAGQALVRVARRDPKGEVARWR
jgi:NADPH:quinone reductase-like Zn-dependent oxidoreductase